MAERGDSGGRALIAQISKFNQIWPLSYKENLTSSIFAGDGNQKASQETLGRSTWKNGDWLHPIRKNSTATAAGLDGLACDANAIPWPPEPLAQPAGGRQVVENIAARAPRPAGE